MRDSNRLAFRAGTAIHGPEPIAALVLAAWGRVDRAASGSWGAPRGLGPVGRRGSLDSASGTRVMKAMVLKKVVDLVDNRAPLSLEELADPVPGEGEVLIRVSVCGVCHTELDEIEGRTPPPRLPVVLGHQVVGRVVAGGDKTSRFADGDRVARRVAQNNDRQTVEESAARRDARLDRRPRCPRTHPRLRRRSTVLCSFDHLPSTL